MYGIACAPSHCLTETQAGVENQTTAFTSNHDRELTIHCSYFPGGTGLQQAVTIISFEPIKHYSRCQITDAK